MYNLCHIWSVVYKWNRSGGKQTNKQSPNFWSVCLDYIRYIIGPYIWKCMLNRMWEKFAHNHSQEHNALIAYNAVYSTHTYIFSSARGQNTHHSERWTCLIHTVSWYWQRCQINVQCRVLPNKLDQAFFPISIQWCQIEHRVQEM